MAVASEIGSHYPNNRAVGIARDQVSCEIIERVADLLRSMIGILLLPLHFLDINPITETEEFLQFRKLFCHGDHRASAGALCIHRQDFFFLRSTSGIPARRLPRWSGERYRGTAFYPVNSCCLLAPCALGDPLDSIGISLHIFGDCDGVPGAV